MSHFTMSLSYVLPACSFGDYFHPSSDFAAFRERVFPFVLLSRSVSMDDLTNMFNNSLHQLSNEDMEFKSVDKIEEHLNPNSARIGSGHPILYRDLSMYLRFGYLRHFPTVVLLVPLYRVLSPRAVAYPRMRR
ncbi:unnamed protein product [Lactuca saligna]|uniref:Uncharacterized protein n=1 Tax=Lactuca saligna TaxID=75948 RepID=A0AA35ZKJ6_LACSI|nr:unnamed protein product [Lactuca saligna]